MPTSTTNLSSTRAEYSECLSLGTKSRGSNTTIRRCWLRNKSSPTRARLWPSDNDFRTDCLPSSPSRRMMFRRQSTLKTPRPGQSEKKSERVYKGQGRSSTGSPSHSCWISSHRRMMTTRALMRFIPTNLISSRWPAKPGTDTRRASPYSQATSSFNSTALHSSKPRCTNN